MARIIRQRDRSKHVPIIFLTAFQQGELDVTTGYSLGAVDFIFAPIAPDVLWAKTSAFIDLDRRAEELKDLVFQAEEANRAKTEFLNMAAHELRTPFSVIAGYVSMLADETFGPLPAGYAQAVDVISSKVSEMNGLLDNLLLWAAADVGNIEPRLIGFDLGSVAEAASLRAQPRATLLGGVVTCDLPARQVVAKGDPEQTARILDNLINNGLTYSRTKPAVRVAVTNRPSPQVEVADSGIGISSDAAEHIFERFFRIRDHNQTTPGMGLGLYVARCLAERQGGSLELSRSTPGSGSSFVLKLMAAERPRGRKTEALGSAQPKSSPRA